MKSTTYGIAATGAILIASRWGTHGAQRADSGPSLQVILSRIGSPRNGRAPVRQNLIPAAIIAAGLIIGGFLAGGRYAIAPSQSNTVARLDRFTGQVSMCVIGAGTDSCDWTVRPPDRPRAAEP